MAQKKFIIDGGFQVNDDSIISANLEMAGHIIPAIDSDGSVGYDLGSPDFKWRDLYLSQGSLYIDGQKVIESNAGTIVVQADIDQSLLTKTTGAGVLTFQSPNPIAIAGTLQMGAGKRITSADGFAVVFGDKVDMDNNQIINIALPTAAGHAATKGYVDEAISALINGAPETLNTLNELANALSDDANFASTVTASLAEKAATTYVDAQDAAITTAYTTAISTEAAARTSGDAATLASAQSYADTAEADAIATAQAYTDARETAITTAYQTYADAAEADANTYTDGEITTLTTYVDQQVAQAVINANDSSSATTDALDLRLTGAEATISTLQSADITLQGNIDAEATARTSGDAATLASAQAYADQAEVDAKAYTDARETAITTAYQTYADQAEVDAKAYTDARETAITTAYTTAIATSKAASDAYADQAEVDAKAYTDARETAITTAYQTYADQAEVDAKAYTDARELVLQGNIDAEATARSTADATLQSQIDFITNNTDAVALDSLAEIVTAFQQADSDLNSAISTLATNATTARDALEVEVKAYADQAEVDAKAYTDTRETAIRTDFATGDTNTLSSAKAYTDAREIAITTAYQTYADAAEVDAKAYTDARETAITTAYQTYADQAEVDAKAYTDARETAITTAYEAYADTAEADANAYTDARETAITTAYTNAIATSKAASDAYADQAEVDAKAYTDARELVLQGNIDAEATARSTADATLQSNINTVAADVASLTTDDVAEGANLYFTNVRAQTAVALDITNAVTAEENARIAADALLQSQIDFIVSNTDGTALDSLTEIVAAFQAADGALDGAITALGAAATTAHNDLEDAITAEATTRATADTNLQNSIDSVAADLVTEATARASGDTSTLTSANSYTDTSIANALSAQVAAGYDLSANTTDDLLEGATNLYYTDARVGTYLTSNAYATQAFVTSAVAGKDNTDEITEGTTNLYFTAARAQAAVADDIATAVSAEATARSAGDTSTLSSAQAYTDSAISALVGGASAAYDTLVEIQNAMATDAELASAIAGLTNVSTADSWTTARTLTLSGDASGSVSIDGSSNVSLSVTVADDSHNHVISNVDGLQTALDGKLGSSETAVAASKLSSAKTISLDGDASGSVLFDGSTNVTLTVTVADDSHNHVISNVDGLQSALNAKLDATSASVSAAKWTTARTLSLSGDASGSVVVDGSADIALVVTVADDSHNHVISNVDGLQSALDAKAASAVTITAGAGLTGGGNLTANRTVNVGAGWGITVAADSVAVNTTTLDARYVQPADMVHFHSSAQTVLASEATTNATGTVTYTFTELNGAKHYAVYLNRLLLRPTEYTVSGTSVIVAAGVLATGDDIEVTGMKLV